MEPFKEELQIGVIWVSKKGIRKADWCVCLGCIEFRGKLLTNPLLRSWQKLNQKQSHVIAASIQKFDKTAT